MIKLAPQHKIEIAKILDGYSETKYEKVVGPMAHILKSYFPDDPKKIGKRLLHGLFSRWRSKENEAIVHYWIICKLIFEYQYPAEQLDLEVPCGGIGRKALISDSLKDSYSDIVVYSHESRRSGTALIVIEARELGGPDGVEQAASYARALNARYHLFSDSKKWQAFETQPYPLNGTPISDIPRWVGYKPLQQRLSKNSILPPITDEQLLRDLVKLSHDQIHSEGLDPAKAFDELVKLFFVKVFDEQELPSVYEFSVLAGETIDETGQHIRDLLKTAARESKYKQLFSEPGDDEFAISNKSIRKVVETFQGFSFTGNSLIGIDAKGTVYENMVGSTFRGELGQYFTPRKIVEFMLDLLEPHRDDLVLDPACGSGGFLIYTLRKVGSEIRTSQKNLPQHKIEMLIKEFADNNIFGSDLSPRMVRTARMNMIMHGDGWAGIVRQHGLLLHKHPKLKSLVGKFTLILSNPPFAGFETDAEILKNYEVGKNEAGSVRGVNRALVFVEEIINLLSKNGRAGLVLPRSILENESYSFKKLRQIIFERTEVIGIVGLPKTAFVHTDTGILGDLLFLRRTDKPRENYDVFVVWANEVGYNTLGHNIEKNELPTLLESFRKKEGKHFIPVRELKREDNLNPWYYHPESKKIRKSVVPKNSNLIPLTKLVSLYKNRISRKLLKETPERELSYLEVGDFDPISGQITSSKKYKPRELPSRATYELNGDELILLPNARNSLESKRRVILVGEETRSFILTNRFTPMIPNVNPHYLIMLLNTDFVRNQMIQACRGAGSPDLRENKLDSIMIPVPDKTNLFSIDGFMEESADLLAERSKLEKKLHDIDKNMESTLNKIVPQ